MRLILKSQHNPPLLFWITSLVASRQSATSLEPMVPRREEMEEAPKPVRIKTMY